MQILIRKGKWHTYYTPYNDRMERIAGRWVEVDTTYLFKDQFNTKNCLRIMLRDVEAIKDDMRPFRKICNWCNNHSAHVDKKCWKCGKSDHFERLTPKRIK